MLGGATKITLGALKMATTARPCPHLCGAGAHLMGAARIQLHDTERPSGLEPTSRSTHTDVQLCDRNFPAWAAPHIHEHARLAPGCLGQRAGGGTVNVSQFGGGSGSANRDGVSDKRRRRVLPGLWRKPRPGDSERVSARVAGEFERKHVIDFPPRPDKPGLSDRNQRGTSQYHEPAGSESGPPARVTSEFPHEHCEAQTDAEEKRQRVEHLESWPRRVHGQAGDRQSRGDEQLSGDLSAHITQQ